MFNHTGCLLRNATTDEQEPLLAIMGRDADFDQFLVTNAINMRSN